MGLISRKNDEERLKEARKSLDDLEKELKDRKKNEEKEIEKGQITIRPYETIRIHDLANMFPFNITPALVESKIQHALAAKIKMQEMTKNFIIFALILMIGGTIAAYIAYKFFGDASLGPQEVKVTVDYVGNVIGASTGNLTG